ncbi:GDSL-type esterase/lipase family protein [uncultured Dokdonia sp.]|uniref:GDSL-type esterase/lipase family protein n=1 Tax=uncultured Dokdonia sp. TaxID=575653 RepID=UPI0026179DEE|nr:GDSL-type esterase/lipase family protein [uncultured Dokdonia sp.]
MKKIVVIFFLFIIPFANLIAQDPNRFDEDIKKFTEIAISKGEELTVFTGSSSIRFWEQLQTDCNNTKVINTGFGGSHMSDLLYFLEETVLRFQPDHVYIYEGDNDIAAEKDLEDILKTAEQITAKILASNPKIKIHFMSAKPSPSRWKYKEKYLAFNSLLKTYCNSHKQLSYIDVWHPMLAKNGRPIPNIFISDSLHMNRQGYLLWKDIICSDFE